MNVHFKARQINDIYELLDADMVEFEEKGYELRCWLVERICWGKEVLWDIMKMGMSLHDFRVETQIWLAIICSPISPYTNMTYVPYTRAHIVA